MDLLPRDREKVVKYLNQGKRIKAVQYLHNTLGLPIPRAMNTVSEIATALPPLGLHNMAKKDIGPWQKAGGVFLVLVGLCGLGIIVNYVQDDYKFTQQAFRIPATVIDIVELESVNEDEGTRSTGYFPVFKYSYQGAEHTHQSKVNFGQGNYKIGETVNVFMNPELPDRILVDTFTERWGAYLLYSLFALLPIVMGYMLLFVIKGF